MDARLSVAPVKISVKRGQMIIRDGEFFRERHLLILRRMAEYSRDSSIAMVILGAGLLVLIFAFAGLTLSRSKRMKMSSRDALFLGCLFSAAVVIGRMWEAVAVALSETHASIPFSALMFLLPIAGGVMVARLVLRLELALFFAVAGSFVLGLMIDGERLIAVYALLGSVLGATWVGSISSRGDILKAGLRVGAGQALAAIAMQLFAANGVLMDYLFVVPMAFASGILSAFVALAMTPMVEALFGYTTDLKLLELGNLNHPALKELIVQAPGTYHHSIIVGSLVEAAAEAIGANQLLSRVMAYHHDLGKGCNAMYFIENQRSETNPHDKLKPSMSAMIIKRHVTDGIDIAKRHRLGEQILAGIAEHHGTTLIQYFYHKAKDQEDESNPVQESDYRYPGRKPQTREAALVMLGDSVEAASRSLADPSPARLKGLVNKIINTKFTDGQLEECDLTLQNLHDIAKAFIRVLNSIYHHRIEYPEPFSNHKNGKKNDGDTDPKPPKQAENNKSSPQDDRPDNIRRLGL